MYPDLQLDEDGFLPVRCRVDEQQYWTWWQHGAEFHRLCDIHGYAYYKDIIIDSKGSLYRIKGGAINMIKPSGKKNPKYTITQRSGLMPCVESTICVQEVIDSLPKLKELPTLKVKCYLNKAYTDFWTSRNVPFEVNETNSDFTDQPDGCVWNPEHTELMRLEDKVVVETYPKPIKLGKPKISKQTTRPRFI